MWPGVRREYVNYKISTAYIFFMPFGKVNEGNLFSVVTNGDTWIQRLAEQLDWICVWSNARIYLLSIWAALDISVSGPSVCIPLNSSVNRCGGWWAGTLPALVGLFSSQKGKKERKKKGLQGVWSLWWFDPLGTLASWRMWSNFFLKTAAASESAVFWGGKCPLRVRSELCLSEHDTEMRGVLLGSMSTLCCCLSHRLLQYFSSFFSFSFLSSSSLKGNDIPDRYRDVPENGNKTWGCLPVSSLQIILGT